MKVQEFVAERRRVTAPVDPSQRQGSGGLIPTENVNFEEADDAPSFIEAPENPPQPKPRRDPKRQPVVPQQPVEGAEDQPQPPELEHQTEDGEELPSDCCGDDADAADRMLLRLRILNTYGKPLRDCFVAVTQDGGQAAAWTTDNGLAEVLIRRPIRTELGEKASEEIEEKSEGKLQAPPPPAPEPGRTPHVNVQVSRRGSQMCNTRLYFQNVPENANDAFWNGTRVVQEAGADYASYDIVVETGRADD